MRLLLNRFWFVRRVDRDLFEFYCGFVRDIRNVSYETLFYFSFTAVP